MLFAIRLLILKKNKKNKVKINIFLYSFSNKKNVIPPTKNAIEVCLINIMNNAETKIYLKFFFKIPIEKKIVNEKNNKSWVCTG